MARSFTLLVPLMSLGPVYCQPVIHATDHLPVPGTTRIVYLQEPNGMVIPTGENMTWDFSWLSMQGTQTATYEAVVDPGLLALGATVSTYNAPALGAVILGVDTGGLKDHFPSANPCGGMEVSDNLKLLPPTLTYGDTLLDDYMSSCVNEFYGQYESGLHTVTGDGWGTLSMPWGIVENVLQITFLKEYAIMEMPPVYVTAYRSVGTRFYHPGAVEPVVAVEYLYRLDGNTLVELYSQLYYIVEVGLGMAPSPSAECRVWPIPAADRVNVGTDSPIPPGSRFEILDQTGRSVLRGSLPTAVGRSTVGQLDISTLDVGTYVIRLMSDVALLGSARLVKR